ncbi:Transmembrane protein [Melia azedarach]|uniref:Transmembrane protein n=2 Tax=Melia azedarach TaxID=155640 RepID=A0ACC1WV91_MELAZ|nr:Transmembrane protein [Melia azedarach]KAJ4702971.1 Transmembrane protein [Melia azedarach]
MVSSSVIATVIASYMPLITILLIRATLARELRPSDHGLEYQSPPPSSGKSSPQMTSFFKGSSSPSTSSNVALPRALNSTDDSWWTARHSRGRDHVKHVMLVASLVCGLTGVVLLVVSAFIYFFRFQDRNSSPSSSSARLSNNK